MWLGFGQTACSGLWFRPMVIWIVRAVGVEVVGGSFISTRPGKMTRMELGFSSRNGSAVVRDEVVVV